VTSNKRCKPERRKIVAAVIMENGITDKEFFGNARLEHIVQVRKEAIRRLAKDGAYYAEIARLIGREVSIVRYHLDPKITARRKIYYHNRYMRLRQC
jgi:hypothetical protein